MNNGESAVLPKFKKPPVNEVVAGIQFGIKTFLPTFFGTFHGRIKDEFPIVIAQQPLFPQFEISPPQGSTPLPVSTTALFGSMGSFPQQRVWFQTKDETQLIQLQSDRLIFNWRKQSGHEYDSFAVVRAGFKKAFELLTELAGAEGMGTITPNQCEMSYINPIEPETTKVTPGSPEKAITSWSAKLGKEWDEPLEDLSFNARYRFIGSDGEMFGRLISTLLTLPDQAGNTALRLDLTARGLPLGPDLDGVLGFFDVGHEAIVKYFAAVTTSEMHAVWERSQ